MIIAQVWNDHFNTDKSFLLSKGELQINWLLRILVAVADGNHGQDYHKEGNGLDDYSLRTFTKHSTVSSNEPMPPARNRWVENIDPDRFYIGF